MSDTDQTLQANNQQKTDSEDHQTKGEKDEEKDQEKITPRGDKTDDANSGKKTKAKRQEQKAKEKEKNAETSEKEDGRSKQKEYFRTELQRLEDSLKKKYSQIQAPVKKPYTPYLFNSLEPYYNTHTAHFLIHMPEEQFHSFSSRATAHSLIDPWLDLKMSTELPPIVTPRHDNQNKETSKAEKEAKSNKKQSNMAHQENQPTRFPVVRMDTKDLDSKPLFYSDVPALREHIKSKYSATAQAKIDQDYKRTQHEFYRMELDRLDQVHPVNRKHMTGVYFAYLQNTPGSKKAVTECVSNLKVE